MYQFHSILTHGNFFIAFTEESVVPEVERISIEEVKDDIVAPLELGK